jgi:energy-coupling factor transport system permease protein
MTLLAPRRGSHVIDRVNPVAKLFAGLLLGVTLVLSLDIVSAGVALALELALFPCAGLGWGAFWRRTAPVWIASVLGGVTIVLYGRPSGETHLQFLLVHVTDGSITLGLATALRIAAIALPAVVLSATIDPTDLADGLAQLVRLPARFVLGALAGLRLVTLFLDDWRALERARRARGLGDGWRVRRVAGQSFAILVIAIRRGSALATAMEARGFGAPTPRTWARESRLHARDGVLVALAVGIAGVAVAVSVMLGTWSFLGMAA